MRVAEARAIAAALAQLPAQALTPCLNLGSSTATVREAPAMGRPDGPAPDLGTVQPHVAEQVLRPLEARGVRIVHADIKAGEGVDLVGDVYDPAYRERVRAVAPRLVICSNLLEHLPDREGFVDFCRGVVAPGGYVLVTVPRSYPYHADPIDTGYRPTPEELFAFFPGWERTWSETVIDTTFWHDLGTMPLAGWPRFAATMIVKFPLLLLTDRARFLSRYHRFLWLARRFSVSCVLVRKPEVE
jgi:SAM-dependent methyltransferase